MRGWLLVLLLLPLGVQAGPFGLHAEPTEVEAVVVTLQANRLLVNVTEWMRVYDNELGVWDMTLIRVGYPYVNATLTLEPRVSDSYVVSFWSPESLSQDMPEGEYHNRSVYVAKPPGGVATDPIDLRGTCEVDGPSDVAWLGATRGFAWGYVVVVEHDSGVDRHISGFTGAPWVWGLGVGYTGHTADWSATGVHGEAHLWAEESTVYGSRCAVAVEEPEAPLVEVVVPEPPAGDVLVDVSAQAPALALDMSVAPAVVVQVQSTWYWWLLVPLFLVALLAALPWSSWTLAAMDRGLHRWALVASLLARGRPAGVVRARALDHVGWSRLAAHAWVAAFRRDGRAAYAERAAAAWARAGRGSSAAAWLLAADEVQAGVLSRIYQADYERVRSCPVFKAAVRRLLQA